MFWKKKAEEGEGLKHIKVPPDSRQAYRISPSELDPIVVNSGKDSYDVADISSGGLSLISDKLKVEDELDITFTLPVSEDKIEARIKVLRVGRKNIRHCQFLGLQQKMEDKIHKYVLERQKEELRF
ncbi:MAG: PilZ domain-containing protein [Candidatus Nitronauta litoralis]|uniref:PilZ domain-containing protein n=1 Tax=Candidatus Nitronauta litoralis TaxID=2705533 RepID=A0A7T0BXY5_9BACT|nr:MAG: PilZ domain-containing protein [Candidatus Nitronauta litoralis]